MDLIIKHRGHGKTTDLVLMSARNNKPILTANSKYVKELAKELGVDIPEPISWGTIKRCGIDNIDSIYIDELDLFLHYLIGVPVDGCTVSID